MSYDEVIGEVGKIRWGSETKLAAEHLGWTVVDTRGVSDYQGWGVHLLQRADEWAVLSWDYGSCSGCDSYEEIFDPYHYTNREAKKSDSGEDCAAVFGELIETRASEDDARALFSERQGW